ncbi:hypothetical protein LNI90_00835 [Tenacibaculum dicentrarchi]|nr:hypothetical protein [Tenacibaculum dicentrarchi]MCD8415433.1 hypothetical protein [Tenacibaculum dicentrarchi]MCD8420465.1 hypothetical protein [Tenacibaculum dicentrarchi]MCD8423827.1 hypothetical protein [Tenacibaculum dicentrarchi]MCD8436841.1 hypothetical protein [Tenacibaculum dicentrarchi]
MKNLHHSLKELTQEESTLINGGNSGWYYLGKAARWITDGLNSIGERAQSHSNRTCY